MSWVFYLLSENLSGEGVFLMCEHIFQGLLVPSDNNLTVNIYDRDAHLAGNFDHFFGRFAIGRDVNFFEGHLLLAQVIFDELTIRTGRSGIDSNLHRRFEKTI